MRIYDDNLSDITFEAALKDSNIGRQTGTNSDMAQIRHKYGVKNSRHENGIVFIELTNIDNLIRDNPKLFSLVNAYPNPFNPSTEIHFTLNKDTYIELSIFDLKGQKVTQIVKGDLQAGFHSYPWQGVTNNGNSVSSGVYFYQLKSIKESINNKILYLK